MAGRKENRKRKRTDGSDVYGRPTLEYFVEEAIYCASESSDWQCYVDSSDMRCLRVLNRNDLTFPDPSPDSIGVCKVDLGIRTAVPVGYAVVVMEVQGCQSAPSGGGDGNSHSIVSCACCPTASSSSYSSSSHSAAAIVSARRNDTDLLFPKVANGVVDSGYRGNVSALIYFDSSTRRVGRGCLVVRLALTKLATVCQEARMLFDLYDAGADYECGFQFVSSIRTAADSDADDGERQSPPDGNDVWDGTGCETLVRLRDEGVAAATRYRTSDKNVAFVVRAGGASVIGVSGKRPRPSRRPVGPLTFYRAGDFATLVKFSDTFASKRIEDAGYDVRCPVDVVLEPMTVTSITVRQRYCCQDGSVIPCIYGRSSMNAKGLPVIPTRWVANEWLTVSVCNTTTAPVKLKEGDRIAQLLLASRDGMVWLPHGPNYGDPFPRSKDYSPFDGRGVCSSAPKWRETTRFDEEAPKSYRQREGFGSTGI